MKVLTSSQLAKWGACRSGLAAFRREFPNGMRVNVENVTRAMAAGLDHWFMWGKTWKAPGVRKADELDRYSLFERAGYYDDPVDIVAREEISAVALAAILNPDEVQ